eukprot:CAMPEP_0194206988 /NCGR_PEP_ID=MMETSP0156-20130528/5875_1 /TAXON_ID=33649 /ORGANISM="Thalassionema nitzschioides, Strain L26-B" /LENGTH=482 /DNA_ID=CAMNT_0038933657 /DNA_START=71 /DNA_END=1515 /DNA_ORIENTATION=-
MPFYRVVVASFFFFATTAIITTAAAAAAAVVQQPQQSIKTASSSRKINSDALLSGDLVGSGAFGHVHWGTYQGRDIVIKSARSDVPLSTSYLDTEAYVNRRLGQACPYIAPYVGDCLSKEKGGSSSSCFRQLVWEKSGDMTLDECLDRRNENDDTTVVQRLKTTLLRNRNNEEISESGVGSSPHTLAREMLRQMLTALSYCHSKGIVHRDIKPGAFLLDDSDGSCLRLIDFGGACDLSSWLHRKGYRGSERGIRTLLYCPPEEFIELDHPFAFDLYSVATTWLRLVIPGLRQSEDAFFDWRMSVRNARHDISEWHETAALSSSLPDGWEDFFACAQGREAWRLLTHMMAYDPAKRPTATDALLGDYINYDCSQHMGKEPPPIPWSLTSHLETAVDLLSQRQHHSKDECVISDAHFTYKVEMPVQDALLLVSSRDEDGPKRTRNTNGVKVQDVYANNNDIQVGDQLLEIGPIDVEEFDRTHVL